MSVRFAFDNIFSVKMEELFVIVVHLYVGYRKDPLSETGSHCVVHGSLSDSSVHASEC